MKKIFFLVLVIFLSLNVNAWVSVSPASSITPSSAIEGNLFKNLSVSAELPVLSLINPKNQTYIRNQSIPISYTASNEESVWYSLDSGENITLTHSTSFSTSQGSHILFLYASNSNGEILKNVTFFVDSSKFSVNKNKYEGEKKGETTNFSNYSYEELQNFSDIILENTDFGKIKFNENINLTDDEDFSDGEIDINSYINISSNRIAINSTALPNFNKTATLSLYDLTFSDPRILREGNICPSTICTLESYAGGILKFNVTSFSVYSAEETPVVVPPIIPAGGSSSGGSGGDGAVIKKIKSFSLDSSEISISLTPGSITTKKITITNILDEKISISLTEENLDGIILLDETQIELEAGETRDISFDVIIREEVVPDLYVGKLIIKNGMTTEEVLVMIEVEYKDALFDLRVNIPEEYSNVLPGKEILAEIELFNLGLLKRADVEIEYVIEDDEGNKVLTEKETIAVETKVGFLKRIKVPENVNSGKYILYVKVKYNERFASATATFNVIKQNTNMFVVLGIAVLLGVIIYIYQRKRQKKNTKKRKRKKAHKKQVKLPKKKISARITIPRAKITKKKEIQEKVKDKYLDLTGAKPRFTK
ncbi:MAG: hypothetical protein M1416_02565 [Candidatus Pacearchaeota archaeon]|nr:hypothetical protein [Candidatus Pacearchaeota archaeon]